MSEKVLITGASGFVGYHLVEAAQARGLEVTAAVRKSSQVDHLRSLNISYVFPDFGNLASLKQELERGQYDYIIHAAGVTKAPTQEAYNRVNADYTVLLAQAAQEANYPVKKMVFMSSLAAVGPLYDDVSRITEGTLPQPVTAYGKSKLLAEERLRGLTLPLIILRPTAVYGPREKDIFILFKTINKGLEPYIGRVQQQLSFIYVKDLAQLTVQALFAEGTSGTYNVSDGKGYDRYELAALTKRFLGKKVLKFHIPMGFVRVMANTLEATYKFSSKTPALNREKLIELTARNWVCDIGKVRRELGFEPAFDLERGMKETIAWYKLEQWL